MSIVKILSKSECEYCDHTAKLCQSEGIGYVKEFVDKQTLRDRCNGATHYPQIFVGDRHVGDYYAFVDWIEDEYEPMLLPNLNRFTVFPIKHPKLWDLYKKAQMSTWTAEEIDLSTDIDDWEKKLNDNERHFIKYILAFFAGSDGIVNENIDLNFASEVQYSEARCFFAFQEHIECVHGETYSKLIDKYIRDDEEKNKLFCALETIPCIAAKGDWAMKWLDKSRPFAQRLLAFACVEGIFFSGAFCAIFWLKKRGLMKGLSFSNELISRDEGLHQEFGLELFKMLRHRPDSATIRAIVEDAVAIEKKFICDALPCALIGMNAESMGTYIEYVADRLLKSIGEQPVWNSKNPYDFMVNQSLDGKSSFFEVRVGDYGKLDDGAHSIEFDAEF